MDDSTARKKPRITVTRNGPYVVSGDVPIADQIIVTNESGDTVGWRQGKEYERKSSCSLCRCGQSNNKPYCDGSHVTSGFDGTETASDRPYLKRAQNFEGPELSLTDVVELCSLGRFCDRAGGIWDLVENSGDAESKEIAIQEGKDCPSGRLVVWDKDGKPIEPAFEPSIGVVEDPGIGVQGPLWVRGGIPVVSEDGSTYEVRNRQTLCRCGRSGNMPFCDGTHALK